MLSQPVHIERYSALARFARSGTIKVGDTLSWFHHPRFKSARDSILEALRTNEIHFRKLKHVVFLCGGLNSIPRDRLAQYLRNNLSLLVFYAEEVWTAISAQPSVNALEMENQLANLADIVIVIVESAGTFAELGAFSLSPNLRSKLLPVLDRQFRDGTSFIETGPVRWVDAASQFAPSILTNLETILDATGDIEDRISRLPLAGSERINELPSSPKHTVFFVCDLIAVFGPCSVEDLQFCADRLLGTATIDVAFYASLGRAMRLVDVIASSNFYYRPLENGRLPGFQYMQKYVSIPNLRAVAVSAMLAIPESAAALESLTRPHVIT